MKEIERLKIALPSGELEKNVLGFVQDIGLNFTSIDRRYLISVENMPIDLVIVRASSIPVLITDKRSELKAGITGSDIIWESGMDKNTGEEMPISAKNSRLYIGVTRRFSNYLKNEKSKIPSVQDLSGIMIATKYPRIAKDVFSQKSIEDILIYPIPGTDEAMQYIFSNCDGILGIISSGTTVERNDVDVLETFHEVTVRMIQASGKLTEQDINILNDFRERVAIAIEKRRMV